MILSLGVIVAIAAGIYIFVPHDEHHDPIKRVDYRVELLTAQRAAAYPVAAPRGLSKDWKPTSVRYRGTAGDAWHLGYLDPQGKYVAVEQSTQDPAKFIDDVTQGAQKARGAAEVDGKSWARYEGDTYDALVLREGSSTTVVTGSASFPQLEEFAAALSTGKAAEPEAA